MSPAARKARSRSFDVLLASAEKAAARAESLAAALDAGVEPVATAELAALLHAAERVGVVVLDLPHPSESGEELSAALDALRAADPGLPLVVWAAEDASAEGVAASFRRGASEVVLSADAGALVPALEPFLARRRARDGGRLLPDEPGVPRIIGASKGMREVARLIERVAPSDATVLILGESGTGKELIARALHVLSPRKKGPFVAINCAAIPDTLLENELFGHEKGAYTGASGTAIGKVEAAEKGTLFLDEIGEMPLQLQSKILRLLQEKTYDRIGGTRTRKADIRIVAATNRDLKEQVAEKRFREDLFYRLSVVPLTLPALRERPEDIPAIALAILERLAASLSRPSLRLTEAAIERLLAYRWPGNVRELENELERAAVLAQGDTIEPGDLDLRPRVADPERAALARLAPLEGPMELFLERVATSAARVRVATTLEETGGDREEAALRLGITPERLNKTLGL